MPLPFILAAVMLSGAAAGGGGAGVLGVKRSSEAKDIDEAARETMATVKRKHARSLRTQERAALSLGERKIQTVDGPLRDLHHALSLFRYLDLNVSVEEDDKIEHKVDVMAFEAIDFDEWRRIAGLTSAGGMILGKATAGGLATSGATMALGLGGAAASTGTAIGTLGGAAATNATLAWFGGGALSAGGYGMAGGTALLGGIAVAPVALAGGLAVLHTGSKALDQAKANRRKAETAAAQGRAACVVLDAVTERAHWCDDILARLGAALDTLVPLVREAATREPDARKVTTTERTAVVTAFRTGELVAEVVALRLVWRGRLTAKSEKGSSPH